jgi:ubiquinone/menaquinone biosynthesis C-methylase UbiE
LVVDVKADTYLLGHRPSEQDRLQHQAEFLVDEANALFDRIGIAPGAHVVEIGCGPRGCLDLLAERVGPDGLVVGVEPNGEAVVRARRYVERRGLPNVRVIQADGRGTGLPAGAFDAVTARLVLVNVPRPHEIVAEAFRLARPGGAVAFHEADAVSRLCDPPLEAWTQLFDVIKAYSVRNGIDVHVARALPRLLRDAGLIDVGVRPLVYVDPPGHIRRRILEVFADNLADRLVADGLITPDELDRLGRALSRHLDDPATVVISDLFIQAWGRKPNRRKVRAKSAGHDGHHDRGQSNDDTGEAPRTAPPPACQSTDATVLPHRERTVGAWQRLHAVA